MRIRFPAEVRSRAGQRCHLRLSGTLLKMKGPAKPHASETKLNRPHTPAFPRRLLRCIALLLCVLVPLRAEDIRPWRVPAGTSIQNLR